MMWAEALGQRVEWVLRTLRRKASQSPRCLRKRDLYLILEGSMCRDQVHRVRYNLDSHKRKKPHIQRQQETLFFPSPT